MIGTTLSHFRIDQKLGAGGMGEVYLAEDTNLHRKVALKVLSKQLAADPKGREMLFTEARAASRVGHPNIATVYEVDLVDGVPFIAMELVDGKSLKELIESGGVTTEQLTAIAQQVAEGLAEAHEAGILHRDIKPGNVMVDERGRAKVLDFGLAVLTHRERQPDEDESDFMTRTATQWTSGGTVPYMAPEQLHGAHADARTDIFSFGVMLYECFTRRLPFFGETAVDTLHAILHSQPTPIRSLVPDISSDWERLIESCIAKLPHQRPASMADIARSIESASTTPVATPVAEEKALAVLYFENLSRSEEDEYFCDGITEDIITELSRIKGLKVFSRSAVYAFRDKHQTATDVGQQLGATHVLEGSLRRAGKRLRITGSLADTRTGHSMWSERYDRQMEDVFAIQDEIALNIAQALEVMLSDTGGNAKKKEDTPDIRAYDHYLKGRQYFHQFRSQGFEHARQMFARAIVLDTNYARAYAGVADCSSYIYMFFDSSEGNLDEADAASRKAIELDPDLAEAHASRALAVSLSKNYEEAEQSFLRAIELNPNLYEAYYFYARAFLVQGKYEEAIKQFKRAAEANPDEYQAPYFMAQAYKAVDKMDEAREAYGRSLEIIKRHLEMHSDDPRALYLGAGALVDTGEPVKSAMWLERALAIDPDDPGVLYNVACGYAQLDEPDRSIDCLEAAFTNAGDTWKDWVEKDPDLDKLRDNPRFKALMSQY